MSLLTRSIIGYWHEVTHGICARKHAAAAGERSAFALELCPVVLEIAKNARMLQVPKLAAIFPFLACRRALGRHHLCPSTALGRRLMFNDAS